MHHAPFLVWFHDSFLGVWMRDVTWLFPTFQAIHLVGMTLLFGVIGIIDLRILGFAKAIPVGPLHELIPLALLGFVINLITGLGFFSAEPYSFAVVVAFRIKLVLLLLAGINALWFWISVSPQVHSWGAGVDSSRLAKGLSLASLIFWVSIIFAGRFIAFAGNTSL
jgi:hypothetical protein